MSIPVQQLFLKQYKKRCENSLTNIGQNNNRADAASVVYELLKRFTIIWIKFGSSYSHYFPPLFNRPTKIKDIRPQRLVLTSVYPTVKIWHIFMKLFLKELDSWSSAQNGCIQKEVWISMYICKCSKAVSFNACCTFLASLEKLFLY